MGVFFTEMQIILALLIYFLTNDFLIFQNTMLTFTSLSDCHKFVLTVLKTTFSKNNCFTEL